MRKFPIREMRWHSTRSATLPAPWVFILLTAGCSAAPVWQHPEFASGQRPVGTIAVLPPNVEISTVPLIGRRKPAAADPMFGDQLFLRAAQLLDVRDYRVVDGRSLCPKSAASSQTLESRPASHEPSGSRPDIGAASSVPLSLCGMAAPAAASHFGADALLLIYYEERRDAPTRAFARNLATFGAVLAVSSVAAANGGTPGTTRLGSLPDREGRLQLVLIDGRSGETLWEKRLVVRGRMAAATFAEQVLSDLPSRGSFTPGTPSTH